MTPAVKALACAQIPFQIREYVHDPGSRSYALEAAETLGVDPGTVFKTLLAQLDGRELVVAVVPASSMLDFKALARVLGAKRAELATPADAQRASGYVVGGISPFGQRKRLRTVVDESAIDRDPVYVSGGRRGLEIALAASDLVRVTGALCARVASG